MRKIKLKAAFKDKRGEITDLIQNENINAVTTLTLKRGAVRANHYHRETVQWNYLISGKIKIVTQFPQKKIVKNIMEKGDLIVTLPDERHALVALEDSELIVFTKGPRAGNEYETDTFRLNKPLIRAREGFLATYHH